MTAASTSDAGAIVWAGAIAASAAILSSALTAYVSYRVQSRANNHQDQRDTRAHERTIRAEKAKRLRRTYAAVLHAADTIEYASKRTGSRFQEETEAERDAEVTRVLREAMIPLPDALAQLRLETDTHAVLDLWKSMYGDFSSVQVAWEMNRQAPGAVPAANIREMLRSVEQGLNKIIEAARKQIDDLSQPI